MIVLLLLLSPLLASCKKRLFFPYSSPVGKKRPAGAKEQETMDLNRAELMEAIFDSLDARTLSGSRGAAGRGC